MDRCLLKFAGGVAIILVFALGPSAYATVIT